MRSCPPEIAEILLEPLETGLLTIGVVGWNGQADCCAVEADLLQNLPRLLAKYHPEGLIYYWDVERVCVLKRAQPEQLDALGSFWR